jgi:hypothetical protein
MIENVKTTAIKATEVKKKAPTVEEHEYFFSGGLAYEPVTIRAKSRKEAEEKWEEVKKEV